MLSRRTAMKLGAALLSPFVVQIPATVDARAEPVIEPKEKLNDGLRREARVLHAAGLPEFEVV